MELEKLRGNPVSIFTARGAINLWTRDEKLEQLSNSIYEFT